MPTDSNETINARFLSDILIDFQSMFGCSVDQSDEDACVVKSAPTY